MGLKLSDFFDNTKRDFTVEINVQVMKAAAIMDRYRMSREDQLALVKILMSAGVDHCLVEQKRLRDDTEQRITRAVN